MELNDWQEKGEYYNYHSHNIFNIDEGQGEVILLIHGFPTASWDWHRIWNNLSEDYRLLTLDMIGFGFSSKPKKYPYSIFDQADLVEQYLAHKQIAEIKILCHDYGNTVTQELLARFQNRIVQNEPSLKIESVCFLNGGLFPEVHQPLMIQKILISPIGSIVSRFFNREKLAKNFRKIFGPQTQPSEKELDQFWELVSNNGGKYIFHLLIKYMREREVNRSRWVGAMQNNNIPLRLIDGTFDPISGQNMVDRYKEIIPHPDVITLNNIGHFPLLEDPESVLKHYLEFIE